MVLRGSKVAAGVAIVLPVSSVFKVGVVTGLESKEPEGLVLLLSVPEVVEEAVFGLGVLLLFVPAEEVLLLGVAVLLVPVLEVEPEEAVLEEAGVVLLVPVGVAAGVGVRPGVEEGEEEGARVAVGAVVGTGVGSFSNTAAMVWLAKTLEKVYEPTLPTLFPSTETSLMCDPVEGVILTVILPPSFTVVMEGIDIVPSPSLLGCMA